RVRSGSPAAVRAALAGSAATRAGSGPVSETVPVPGGPNCWGSRNHRDARGPVSRPNAGEAEAAVGVNDGERAGAVAAGAGTPKAGGAGPAAAGRVMAGVAPVGYSQ